MPKDYDIRITDPYKKLEFEGLQYGFCRDFDHISRYKGLRQMTHNAESSSQRFITLELQNSFNSNIDFFYHEISVDEENRLDLLAAKYLGSATYSWIIAMFNNIQDGFTVHAGERIKIPSQFTSLFNKGEMLASVSAFLLNLGSE